MLNLKGNQHDVYVCTPRTHKEMAISSAPLLKMEVGCPVQDELCLGVLYLTVVVFVSPPFSEVHKKKSLREKVEEPSRGRGFERRSPPLSISQKKKKNPRNTVAGSIDIAA